MVKEIIFSYNPDSLLTDITSVLLGGTGYTHLFNSLLTQVFLCLLGEDAIDLFFYVFMCFTPNHNPYKDNSMITYRHH